MDDKKIGLSAPDDEEGMLGLIVRFCSGESLTQAEKMKLDRWTSGSPERAELVSALADPEKARLLIRSVLVSTFAPRTTPPPNEMVEWVNKKSGSDLEPFYFG